MDSVRVSPVAMLREHLTRLEAGLTVCLADTGHKAVHRLRTETRRVEAVVKLLGLVPHMPPHAQEAKTLLRSLRKLRRAAGSVRDFDVHRAMLEELAAQEDVLAAAAVSPKGIKADAANETATKNGIKPEAETSADEGQNAALLSRACLRLRHRLERKRESAAADMLDIVRHRQQRIAGAAQALLSVLEPAESLTLGADDLLRNAETLFTSGPPLRAEAVDALGSHDLHEIRKAAKRARYVVEEQTSHSDLRAATERFESLQDAGGHWHDALQLLQAARRQFGKDHALTALYRTQRDSMLATYRQALHADLQQKRSAKQASAAAPHAKSRANAKPPARAATEKDTRRGSVRRAHSRALSS